MWPRKSGEPAGCVNTATGSSHRKTEAKMGENNWAATADRIETILDCLTNRAVSMTVSMDRGAAKRAVEYCQHRAAGADEDTDAEAEIIEFLGKHGQSLDWVFGGDPTGMICKLASDTSSFKPPSLRIVG
jgi:hypothetical protein